MSSLLIVKRWTPLQIYAGILALATLGLFALLLQAGFAFGDPWWAIAILAGLALWAERQHVRVTATTEATVSVLPILFTAVVFGPLAAMVVGAVGLLGDLRQPYIRWVIWTSTRSLAAGLAGLAAFLVISNGDSSFGSIMVAVLLAAITDALIDTGLNALTAAFRGTTSSEEFLKSVKPIVVATISLYAPITGLLVFAYQEISPWSALLFIAPAFAAQSFYRMYREEREASGNLKRANERLERASYSFAASLVAALDARDRYTAGHSAAVAVYARDIAHRMGLSESDQQLAYLAGLLHDIGKVGLPPSILEKSGPLTLSERRQMEEHSEIGERILAKVEAFEEIADIVRHHHERVDGNGYPDGLAGQDIPLISRIIGVADAYNAMTSGRPYRDAMPSRVARMRLAQAVESQFDTTIVAAFEAILAGASESYHLGADEDFNIVATERVDIRLIAVGSAA